MSLVVAAPTGTTSRLNKISRAVHSAPSDYFEIDGMIEVGGGEVVQKADIHAARVFQKGTPAGTPCAAS